MRVINKQFIQENWKLKGLSNRFGLVFDVAVTLTTLITIAINVPAAVLLASLYQPSARVKCI